MTEHDPKAEQYARKAAGWSDAEYADGHAYLAHRAELVASLGVPLDRLTRCSTLRAATAVSARTSSPAGSATPASTPSPR